MKGEKDMANYVKIGDIGNGETLAKEDLIIAEKSDNSKTFTTTAAEVSKAGLGEMVGVEIADKETLDKVDGNVQTLVRNLVPQEAPVYGMIIHESNMDPKTRVEYVGANKDFTPLTVDLESTHKADFGGWADWSWLKGVVPVMCDAGGGIAYYLDPDDYTKQVDGTTESDVAKGETGTALNAMVVIPKIYTKQWKVGQDRHVLFCERQLDPDFLPVGFSVGGKVRDYMLIPMFYGSIDSTGKMRSIAGNGDGNQVWSCGTASGSTGDTVASANIDTTAQQTALGNTSSTALFFGGPITNTLADICVMLSKSTDSQGAFGSGMSFANTAEHYLTGSAGSKDNHYNTSHNTVVGGGMFYGTNDGKSLNKIFHSEVLGSYMLWQRDPYMVAVNGRIKVSPEYEYDLTGAKYVDTGMDIGSLSAKYLPYYEVSRGFGAIPSDRGQNGTSATGYCDATWASASITAVSLRFGGGGARCGLFARTLYDAASDAGWGHGASLLLPGPAASPEAE